MHPYAARVERPIRVGKSEATVASTLMVTWIDLRKRSRVKTQLTSTAQTISGSAS
jgi:hypothetical protein